MSEAFFVPTLTKSYNIVQVVMRRGCEVYFGMLYKTEIDFYEETA